MMELKRVRGRHAAVSVTLLLALTSVGCALSGAHVDAVRKFSLSTATVGDIAASEFVTMRNSTIEMNVARLKLDPSSSPAVGDLDEAFDVAAVEARVKAATVLKAYGELLLSLATDSQTEEIKKASDKFLSSVGSLPAGDRKLNDKQTEALGTIVTTIGGWIVEYKKAKAVRKIVGESSQQVAHLCTLLAADFDPAGQNLATGFQTTVNELRLVANDVLTGDIAAPIGGKAQAIAGYRLAAENGERLQAVSQRASVAVKQLATAQQALVEALASKKPSLAAIKELAKQAKTLHGALKVLGTNPSMTKSEA